MVQHLWLNIKHQFQHRLSDRQQAKNLKKMKGEGVLPMESLSQLKNGHKSVFCFPKWFHK